MIQPPRKTGWALGLPALTARPPYGGQAAPSPGEKVTRKPAYRRTPRSDETMNRTEAELRNTRPPLREGGLSPQKYYPNKPRRMSFQDIRRGISP